MAFSSILSLERIAAGQIVKFVPAGGRMEVRHMKQMAEPQLQREPPAFGRAEPRRITQEQIGAYLEILRERGCTPDTIKSYRRNLNQFFAFLRGGRELTRDSVAGWRDEMLSRGYMPRTVNNRLSAANGLLGYLNLREYQAPAQIKLEEDDEIQPELTRKEYLRLLSAARALNRERLYLLVKTFAVLGLLPASALAAEPDGQTRADNVETLDASVEYDSTARTSATITYHKEAQDAPDVNIVFLLDVSWQGSESFPQFRQMISEAGDALFDHTDAQMQMITYTQTAVLRERSGASVDSSVCTEGWELRNLLAGVGSGGGTTNAAAGLKEAAKVVGDIGNGNPTIVFWVLEDSFGNVDGATGGDAEEPVREALTALKGKLDGEGDALITWQLADKPHELLADAATAISGGEVAAYAANGREEFRAGMLESLENLVHDHYRDLTVTLPLAAGQQLVEKIISAQWESESGALHELTPTVSGDGRSVTVTIGETGALIQSPYTVEVGKPHSVVTMPENAATYYRFGGWTPSLTINKTGVSLIHGTDGYYTGTDSSGKTYQWTSTLLRSYVSIYSDWKLFCNWENSAYVLHRMWKSYAWID